MNLFNLSWKNITFRPLRALLSILLFALGIGLVTLLLLSQKQLQDNFDSNLAGVNLVIGAKGSPLQLILNSMYHIDAPTGNISIKEARPFLRPDHPLIESSLPLSLGDNYRNFRIVGTTPDILNWYNARVNTGQVWQRNFEVTIGAKVARDVGMGLGSTFKSSHGLVTDEDMDHTHDDEFTVVGVLAPTGTVIDQLILTTPETFWLVHDDHDHDHDHAHDGNGEPDHAPHEHDDHAHEDHNITTSPSHNDHDHEDHNITTSPSHNDPTPSLDNANLIAAADDKEITAILVRYKARNIQALNLQRNINENTDLQAATPAIEINRLFALFGTLERALRALAIAIILVSAISIFIALFSSLRERRYELALMRVMGAGRSKLFLLILAEGILLAILGCAAGLLIGHLGMNILANIMEDNYRYAFTGWQWLNAEWLLVFGAIGIGTIAALLPAVDASRTDIAETLTQG